jgi:hypothetical protein
MARKEKKYHFIYKTTNILSGKYYIGMHSTDNLEDGYMGSGKRLRYSLNKYGKENHKVEILEFFDSRKELAVREKDIVNLNEIAKEECLNLVVGGGAAKYTFSDEKKLFENGKRLGDNHAYRLKTDKEYLDKVKKRASELFYQLHRENKLSNTPRFSGGKHTQDARNKIGLANMIKQRGELNSQYNTCWITNGTENKKVKKDTLKDWLSAGWLKGRR